MTNKWIIPLLLLIPLIAETLPASAQQRNLTIEDVVQAARRGLTPAKLDQLQWIPGSESFSYSEKTNGVELLRSASPASDKVTTLVSLERINSTLSALKADTLTALPIVKWKDAETFTFEMKGGVYGFQIKSGQCTRILDSIPAGAEHSDWNNQKNALAYTIGNNLWIATPSGHLQVTHDSDPDIVNGDIVHREEFGIHKGTFWSPAGNMLAFYRMDQTMVTGYPIMELDQKPAGAKSVKYPMAGATSHQVTIGIYHLGTGKTVFLKTGLPADQYLTNISWQPDEQAVYTAILNRDQNHLWMKKYNPATGAEEAVLFEETDPAYIQPLNPMSWNKQGTRFIWQSRRDGYNHLYLYDASGKLLKQLTSGRWEVTEFHGFNHKGTTAFFTANRELPINRDLYAVELSSGKISRLTNGQGVHKCQVNATGSHVLDEFTGPGIPRDTRLIAGTGKQIRTLLSSGDPLAKYTPVGIELFTILNDQGDSLYCRMLKPAGFDSTRKYPVLVYVYGGPGINLITNTWTGGADLWMRFMAQRGFVVFTLENRGTPNRGRAFEQATFRKLGDVEMEDQIAGVKYLMKKQYVDPARMGLYGWSYGGFMTVSMMTRNPGIFKTAVAGGPVIDWSMYEVMYTERYMDTPESNPQGYSKSNLLNHVGNLRGRMMLIHGTSDDVVVWQHSLLYLKQAVQQNIQLDYFVYPGHEHNVTGKDRVHLLNKVSNYFFEHLQ